MTPLHFASRDGFRNMVKVLLAANADVNAKDNVSRILCVYVPQVMLVFVCVWELFIHMFFFLFSPFFFLFFFRKVRLPSFLLHGLVKKVW